MFENSLTLPDGGVVSITDTDNGRTIRQRNAGGGTFITLTIARQESSENKPIITDRYLVQRATVIPGSAGKPNRAAVALTFSYPREGYTHAGMIACLTDLLTTIMGAQTSGQTSALTVFCTRLFNGET